MHFGTGLMIEKKDIPSYKGKPFGPGPFERTACGVYVRPKDTTTDKDETVCNSCKRTRTFKLADIAQPWEWFEYPEECEEPDPRVWRRLDLDGERWLALVIPPESRRSKWRWKVASLSGECESERHAKDRADTELAKLAKTKTFRDWLSK